MAVPGRCSVAFAVAFCQCRPRARRAAQTPEARPPRTAGHAPQAQVAGGQDTPRPIDPAATPPRRIGHTQLSANGTQSPISLNSYHVSYDYLIIQNGPFNPLLSGRARHSIMIHVRDVAFHGVDVLELASPHLLLMYTRIPHERVLCMPFEHTVVYAHGTLASSV
jgi:hypothetical protein